MSVAPLCLWAAYRQHCAVCGGMCETHGRCGRLTDLSSALTDDLLIPCSQGILFSLSGKCWLVGGGGGSSCVYMCCFHFNVVSFCVLLICWILVIKRQEIRQEREVQVHPIHPRTKQKSCLTTAVASAREGRGHIYKTCYISHCQVANCVSLPGSEAHRSVYCSISLCY